MYNKDQSGYRKQAENIKIQEYQLLKVNAIENPGSMAKGIIFLAQEKKS